jgi:alkanesulfonate monooxygenase SsuD/methylene tetrahydromethanopterin reductase-like flavin-dependent oxidoreductase (luciferase family)
MQKLLDHEGDLDYLLTETPSVMIGTPDDFIERLRELEQRGVDEVLLRIDGMPHDAIMRSLQLIGHEVIPAVNQPAQAVA